MTRKHPDTSIHLFIISVLLGVGLGATIIYGYHLTKRNSSLALNDALHHVLEVHGSKAGMADLSLSNQSTETQPVNYAGSTVNNIGND